METISGSMKNPRNARASVVRIHIEPDYAHPAWSTGADAPDYATTPDAFYVRRELAYPRPAKAATRKSPHSTLSRTQLRKRLYAAGVRGSELRRNVSEVISGSTGAQPLGVVVLGRWTEGSLRERFGKRTYKALTRFVARRLILVDEMSEFFAPQTTETLDLLMRLSRKMNSVSIVAAAEMPK